MSCYKGKFIFAPIVERGVWRRGEKERDVTRFLKTLALTAYELHQDPGMLVWFSTQPFFFFYHLFVPLGLLSECEVEL